MAKSKSATKLKPEIILRMQQLDQKHSCSLMHDPWIEWFIVSTSVCTLMRTISFLIAQGWFTVLANLSGLLNQMRSRLDDFFKEYKQMCLQVGHWEANFKK